MNPLADIPLTYTLGTGLELLFLGALVLAVVAGLLLRPKPPKNTPDDRPPTTSQRGEQANYFIGRREINPKVLWVGRRTSREEGGGGKKGGGGGGGKQTVFYEDAVHQIGLGPGDGFFRIIDGNNILWEGPVTPDTTPSGSTLQDVEGNAFTIYWGEINQPINTDLGAEDALGISSRWPFNFYIHWRQRRLGTSSTWLNITYEASCRCVGTNLPDSDCVIPATSEEADDGGQNGAHILYQLMTGKYPHGGGMPVDWIDFGSLKALGVLLQTERLPQNILMFDDTTLDQICADLFADMGVFPVQDQGKLVFMPIRPGQTAHVVNENIVVSPLPGLSILHGQQADDSITWLYPDSKRFFRDTDIQTDDDSTANAFFRKKNRELHIKTITDEQTAALVADRRKQMLIADGNKISFALGMTGRRFVPGHLLSITGIGIARVTGSERDSLAGKSRIDAALDFYALASSGWEPENPEPDAPGGGGFGEPDDEIRVLEAPRRYVGQSLAIVCLRGRDSGLAASAAVHVSLNGTTYANVGVQNPAAASGALQDDLLANPKRRILEQGPTVSLATFAANKVLDLSGDLDGWRGGRQVCLIDGEAMFLQSITALGGGLYRLNGLIRGRLETEIADHFAFSAPRVFIIPVENLVPITHASWVVGARLWVKVVPAGVPIDTVPAQILDLTGKALGPLPISNLSPLSYQSGSDINFVWDFRLNIGTGAGAGEQRAGMAAGAPVQEGTFRVRILNLTGNEKRVAYVSTPAFSYIFFDRNLDGIANSPFLIEITNINGSTGGYPRTFEIGVF